MTTDGSLFASAIEHHLELKRRNQHLDDDLPLDEFIGDDPFANHPLFKTEADARREEEETGEHPVVAAQAHRAAAGHPEHARRGDDGRAARVDGDEDRLRLQLGLTPGVSRATI